MIKSPSQQPAPTWHGYDTLGMAVSLYSHFTFERADKLTITGCPEEFQTRITWSM
ncbi:MAG: hypothetical protein ACLS3M_12700 [Collinsella sp.]